MDRAATDPVRYDVVNPRTGTTGNADATGDGDATALVIRAARDTA